MDNILISIITVCYNAENTIEETIKSVISQTYNSIQYIIIDGKSKDNTISTIKKYIDYIDILISEQDKGIYDAMNKGLTYVKGDYVIFMNAGDLFNNKTTVQEITKHINDKETIYFGNSIRCFSDQKKLKIERINRFRITRKNICHQAIFYPSEYIKQIGYDLKYPILADWVLNIRLYKQLKYKHVNIPICIFDETGISSSSNRFKDINFVKDLSQLTLDNLGYLPWLYLNIRRQIRCILCQN